MIDDLDQITRDVEEMGTRFLGDLEALRIRRRIGHLRLHLNKILKEHSSVAEDILDKRLTLNDLRGVAGFVIVPRAAEELALDFVIEKLARGEEVRTYGDLLDLLQGYTAKELKDAVVEVAKKERLIQNERDYQGMKDNIGPLFGKLAKKVINLIPPRDSHVEDALRILTTFFPYYGVKFQLKEE